MDSVTQASSNAHILTTVQDSLQKAEDFRIIGEFEAAKTIYFQLLNDGNQTPDTHWEANKKIVQMQFGCVGSKLNENKVRVPYVSYSVDDNYQLDTKDRNQFLQMSADNRNLHANFHFELAKNYQQNLPKNTTNNSSFFFFGGKTFTESQQEFKQALCIAHLKIASELGLAKASLELANIYGEGKYLIPPEHPQEPNTDKVNKSIAISYATKAEEQATNQQDGETMLNLGTWHENFSFSLGKNSDAERCYKIANDLGHQKSKENCLVQ